MSQKKITLTSYRRFLLICFNSYGISEQECVTLCFNSLPSVKTEFCTIRILALVQELQKFELESRFTH